MPLKYLGNFWRALEMSLINCKVESKLKRTKYCVLTAAGADNAVTNPNNIILLSKTQNYIFLSSLYYQKTNKSYQDFLAKNLKDRFI